MSFWALALLLLIFISKLSWTWAGMPSQVSVVVFQHGLHPYLNVIFSFFLGAPLLLRTIHSQLGTERLSRMYRALLWMMLLTLTLELLLQSLFMDSYRGFYSWAALLCTYWIVILFGAILPVVLAPQRAVRFLSLCSLIFVVMSLVLLGVQSEQVFKGGRFVGVFKHIPYMVTCATVGSIFPLACLGDEKREGVRWLWGLGILSSFGALLLTGTRSALAAVLMAWVLWLLRVPAVSAKFRYFKFAVALVLVLTAGLFGARLVAYATDVATGKAGLFEREAQNGVVSRLEEVERGWEFFQTSPWIGQGLLSKFSSQEGLDVSKYNSFKDPHNIFASAGVVGGWPFIVWTGVFLFVVIALSCKALMSENATRQIFGIYAVVQIPILIIYHWHLSLGGMADRLYWLVFGYLALSRMNWVK